MEKRFITSSIIVLILAALVFSGCATGGKKKADKEEQVIDAMTEEVKTGSMDRAIEIYEQKKVDDPLLYSILLLNNNRVEEAETVLKGEIEKDNSNIKALYYLSLVYNLKGNRLLEKELLEKILLLDPENMDANISLGRIHASDKKYKEAELCFGRALSKGIYSEEAELGLARVLLEQKKNDEALKHYSNVIDNNRDNQFAYMDRSWIRALKEDYEGAEKDLDEAVRIDPGYIWNYLDRGRIRLYSGKYKTSAEDFTKALEMDNTLFIAYAQRAEAYEMAGRDDLALSDYKKALTIREDYIKGYVPYAMQLYREGEWKESAEYFLKAYNLGKNPEYMLLSAAALLNSGEKEKAGKLITDNMNSIPRESVLYHIARFYIDQYYETIALQKLNEEKKSFERMKGMFYLAIYYDTFGNNSISEKYYTEIIDSGFPETLEYRLSSWKLSDK
ncbi:MAG: tetratricopeptide repeat protein [Spirochaetia bacterium]|jgi:tetratricopeptide (TPR) repeat protein|nr:tetratricopeptide repeat protein [Spirochaetia bacterium]